MPHLTNPDIDTLLLKADKTLHKIGTIAQDNIFDNLDYTLIHERDVIFIVKKGLDFGRKHIALAEYDALYAYLISKITLYDYGALNPIYDTPTAPSALNAVSTITQDDIDDWNESFANMVTAVAVTGTSTKTITLTQQDLGTLTAQWTDIDKNYVHDQQVAAASWVVAHNLGRYASTSIVDTANDEVVGSVHYDSTNQITITFSSPISGKAYIN